MYQIPLENQKSLSAEILEAARTYVAEWETGAPCGDEYNAMLKRAQSMQNLIWHWAGRNGKGGTPEGAYPVLLHLPDGKDLVLEASKLKIAFYIMGPCDSETGEAELTPLWGSPRFNRKYKSDIFPIQSTLTSVLRRIVQLYPKAEEKPVKTEEKPHIVTVKTDSLKEIQSVIEDLMDLTGDVDPDLRAVREVCERAGSLLVPLEDAIHDREVNEFSIHTKIK